ncbi:MAG: carboxypeptidase regulatory-like domain-containing protein, partial [Myxococcaceae bacterium]
EGRFVATAVQTLEGQSRSASATLAVEKTAVPPVRIRFAGGLSISGRVRTRSGQPVALAEVTAVSGAAAEPGGLDLSFRSKPVPSSTRTGEDGAFTLRYLEPGSYRVSAARKGFVAGKEKVFATTGQTGVVITLDRVGSVKGRVLDDHGKPMAHFELNGYPIDDVQGAFELPARRPGELQLLFKSEGFAPAYRTAQAAPGEEVVLPDVVMSRGRTLKGKVVDAASGAPIAGALVDAGRAKDLSATRLYVSPKLGAVESRPDGAFTLPNVPDGQVLVVAQEKSHRELRTIVEAGQSEVVLRLERGAAIIGAVVGSGGSPVKGATIQARSKTGNGSTETKEDGTYELAGLAAGRYEVSAEGPTGDRFLPRTIEVPGAGSVRVDFAAPKESAKLRLKMISPTPGDYLMPFMIQGDFPTPSSLKDFEAAEGGIEGEREGPHGPAGVHVFKGLPAGRFTLFIMAPRQDGFGIYRQVVDLVPGEQHLEVKVPATLPFIKVDSSFSEGFGD